MKTKVWVSEKERRCFHSDKRTKDTGGREREEKEEEGEEGFTDIEVTIR